MSEPDGTPVGRRVRLPKGAERPFEVFVSGVGQKEGADYRVLGRELVFTRQLHKEGKLAWWRWAALTIGLFGTYRRNDVVDLQFRRAGRAEFASDLAIEPDRGAHGPPQI